MQGHHDFVYTAFEDSLLLSPSPYPSCSIPAPDAINRVWVLAFGQPCEWVPPGYRDGAQIRTPPQAAGPAGVDERTCLEDKVSSSALSGDRLAGSRQKTLSLAASPL